MVSSNENRRRPLSSGEVEGVTWQGLRTIFLQKNSQGFGFTLRHFIVYPPESSLHILKVSGLPVFHSRKLHLPVIGFTECFQSLIS